MLERYYYTDKEIERLCKSIVILVDTREKKNLHITDWFNKKKIPWKNKALCNGDYSMMVPADTSLDINRDIYFDKEIIIERKQSLDEIASNFTTNRARFKEEFSTFDGYKYLLIEGATYGDVIKNNYNNKLSTKAFLASLHSFNHKYRLDTTFMPDPQYSAPWIYGTLYYYLKSILR